MIKSAIFEPNLLPMNPRSILLLVLLLLGYTVSAQYTEKINTNRPGTSQGAFSVGNNVLQLEGGMGFGKEKHKIFDTKTNVFNFDYAVRYGLLIEQLEIRLNGRFRADGVKQTIGANEEKIQRSDFEINTLGAKYLIYDPYKRPKKDSINYDALKSWKEHHRFKWKTLIPAVSAYAGANFVTSDNPFTFPDDPTFSPIFAVIAQNNWTTSYGGDWAFVTNIIVDKVTTDNPAIGWILTATHTVNEKWAGFLEYQGQKSDFYSDNILRMGGAYLFNQDVQFDANLAFNFKDTPSIWTLSFGASYRFDWHKKDEIIEKPGLEGGVKEGEEPEEGEEGIEGELDEEFNDIENDSLKQQRTPFINTFEDDSFREEMEQDLDERRTAERLERERIEQEKVDKKEGKKLQKEEARRLKREEKEARDAEKAALKAEKEKEKMLQDIDAELDKMEKEQGVDGELDDIDKQLQELEKMENELIQEEQKEKEKEGKEEEKKTDEKEEKEEKVKEEQEEDIDAEYEQYQQQQEKAKKEEEKRRKKEDKRRAKEDKKRKKEEEKKKKNAERDPKIDQEIDKELEDF